jgi:hypothetical protein
MILSLNENLGGQKAGDSIVGYPVDRNDKRTARPHQRKV